jgi:hypothetical protein
VVMVVGVVDPEAEWDGVQEGRPRGERSCRGEVVGDVERPLVRANDHVGPLQRRAGREPPVAVGDEVPHKARGFGRGEPTKLDPHVARCDREEKVGTK